MLGKITRRSAMELLGAGSFAGAMLTAGGAQAAEAGAESVSGRVPAALEPGAAFGRWTIAAVRPVAHGVLHLDVNDRQGHEFALEILARDLSPASRPPAEVGGLAIYVCNGGDGWLPTAEEQGLAAMTLARLLDKHGQTGPIAGLLTHAQRVVAHGDVLSATFTPPT